MIRDSFAPEFLSPRQVAELSGLSYTTVMRAIWKKKLYAEQRDENCALRIPVAAYDAWMAGRRYRPTQTTQRSA